jgi:hypothetical protein
MVQGWEKRLRVVVMVLVLVAGSGIYQAWAGPPFVTDDPETVEYRHGEAYLATQYAYDKDVTTGVAPLFEFNYGILPDMQLHLVAPFVYDKPRGLAMHYGFGDMELGVKYRFIHETEVMPQMAIFPMLEIPTGNSNQGLGNGSTQVFVPVWVQKSWGPWTTYGGGGYWINNAPGSRNYWRYGWEAQYTVNDTLTVGTEIFGNTPMVNDAGNRIGFNVGTIVNFSEEYHLLISVGRDIHGDNNFSLYAGLQWTFGHDNPK